MSWFVRKWFWITLGWFKAAMNRPLNIPMPPASRRRITPVPLANVMPPLSISKVRVCPPQEIPEDERSRSKTFFYALQVCLYRIISPMQASLPSIDPNPDVALRGAYTWLHRTKFGPPVLPAEFLASPELGALAVRGPYACYTQKVDNRHFEWDLWSLNGYEVHPGLYPLGAKVQFEADTTQRTLRAVRIKTAIGTSCPGDTGWELGKKLALCSATTHMSLVRHFNWVHLAAAANVAIATRNQLPDSHPLLRLLWPYIYATQQSNEVVSRGQMLPDGDFETIFSFTLDGMCRLFDDSWGAFAFGMNDPVMDATRRHVPGEGFDTPTEDNLAQLFGLMHDHARHYLSLYYPAATGGASGASLDNDTSLKSWLDELNRLVPNGVGVTSANVTFDSLACLVAQCIYLVSAQHEILGSFLWNYQLWTHRQPVRVYASNQPEPLDVYQRLVNANFNLNVTRRALIYDFGYLGLDPSGAAAMRRFSERLAALQEDMEREPWTVWKLYPSALKVNINA